MRHILKMAMRALLTGLTMATVSMMTSIWNGVGIKQNWTLALAVLLVTFIIVFIVLIKQTWDEYSYLKNNFYNMEEMTKEDYFHAMQKMEDENKKK